MVFVHSKKLSGEHGKSQGLLEAVSNNRVDETIFLLNTGLVAVDGLPGGPSPLAVAVSKGFVRVAQALLDYGADPNHMMDRWAPLHVAVLSGQLSCVALLLKHGARPGILSLHSGETPAQLIATGQCNASTAVERKMMALLTSNTNTNDIKQNIGGLNSHSAGAGNVTSTWPLPSSSSSSSSHVLKRHRPNSSAGDDDTLSELAPPASASASSLSTSGPVSRAAFAAALASVSQAVHQSPLVEPPNSIRHGPIHVDPAYFADLALGGLPNLGNTCFVNAVVQALLAPPTRELLFPLDEAPPQGAAAADLMQPSATSHTGNAGTSGANETAELLAALRRTRLEASRESGHVGSPNQGSAQRANVGNGNGRLDCIYYSKQAEPGAQAAAQSLIAALEGHSETRALLVQPRDEQEQHSTGTAAMGTSGATDRRQPRRQQDAHAFLLALIAALDAPPTSRSRDDDAAAAAAAFSRRELMSSDQLQLDRQLEAVVQATAREHDSAMEAVRERLAQAAHLLPNSPGGGSGPGVAADTLWLLIRKYAAEQRAADCLERRGGALDSEVGRVMRGQHVALRVCQQCGGLKCSAACLWTVPLHFPEASASAAHAMVGGPVLPLTTMLAEYSIGVGSHDLQRRGPAAMARAAATAVGTYFLPPVSLSCDSQACKGQRRPFRKLAEWLAGDHDLPPPVVVLQLCRFAYDRALGAPRKIGTRVRVPLTLDLSQCAAATSDHSSSTLSYSLYACVLHHGITLDAGHYSALVKSADGGWFHINDELVHRLYSNSPADDVPGELFYLLFYERLDAM